MNRKTRRLIQNLVVLVILAIGIWWICIQFIKFNISTYTDNAQVRRHIVPVTARVQGYIKEVRFDEYSYVHKGDTLVIIEDREYQLKLAKARKDYAALNVSYTVITAPTDGYTSKKTLQEGQFVQPGQTLLSIVDENDVWVVANYKETQTAKMKIGDRVRITVDAIPGVEYIGAIESISNATGAQYSIVPQDNATGNFVKVEQRLPVKIRFTKENSKANIRRLRAGLNVECEMMD